MYRYIVVYRKSNGDIIYRARTSNPQYTIGQYTSMGWQVLDIKRLHKGRSLSYEEYDVLLNKKRTISNTLAKINTITITDTLKIVLLIMAIVYFIVKLNK